MSGWREQLALARERVESYPPWRVLAAFVAAQWCVVLGIALVVRHQGWLWYQGGDQLWYYTSSWVLVHGHMPWPSVGYLWSFVMAPFALVGGPNLLSTLPGIILIDVLVVLPGTILALYGIARLIAGRLFAYWTLLLWISIPLLGILYTNTGYHQKYTELLLPQGLGLTGMADFPIMAATLASCYFVARTLFTERPSLVDGLAAGLAAGAAFALKPSGTIFAVGPVLAFLATRRFRPALAFAAGIVPAALTLALWKWRGFGHLPITSSRSGTGAASIAPVLGIGLHVPNLSWAHLSHEFDLLREHFWSGRVIQWLVVAGLIGLARRSWPSALLVGGWFGAYVIVKGTYIYASIEDGSMERVMIPSFPAFVLLVASIPFLWPGLVAHARPEQPGPHVVGPNTRIALVVATIVGTAVVPFAAIAAVGAEQPGPRRDFAVIQEPAIPVNIDLGVRAVSTTAGVRVTWRPQHPAGGAVFFHVYRTPASESQFYTCTFGRASSRCTSRVAQAAADNVVQGANTYLDHPSTGRWHYFVGVAANWINDPTGGDVYLLSRPVTVTVP